MTTTAKLTAKEVRRLIEASPTYLGVDKVRTRRDGSVEVMRAYYYRHGMTAEAWADKVRALMPAGTCRGRGPLGRLAEDVLLRREDPAAAGASTGRFGRGGLPVRSGLNRFFKETQMRQFLEDDDDGLGKGLGTQASVGALLDAVAGSGCRSVASDGGCVRGQPGIVEPSSSPAQPGSVARD
jgi:hypothetical protein